MVYDDVIARPNEGGDGAVSRRPARRIEGDMLHLEEPCQMLLQLQRQTRVAEQDRGPGAVRAELAHGLDAGGGNAWMPAEPKVILGGEVDALPRRRRVVRDGGVGTGRLLRRTRGRDSPLSRCCLRQPDVVKLSACRSSG